MEGGRGGGGKREEGEGGEVGEGEGGEVGEVGEGRLTVFLHRIHLKMEPELTTERKNGFLSES